MSATRSTALAGTSLPAMAVEALRLLVLGMARPVCDSATHARAEFVRAYHAERERRGL